jgi:RecJ-like exonuclease
MKICDKCKGHGQIHDMVNHSVCTVCDGTGYEKYFEEMAEKPAELITQDDINWETGEVKKEIVVEPIEPLPAMSLEEQEKEDAISKQTSDINSRMELINERSKVRASKLYDKRAADQRTRRFRTKKVRLAESNGIGKAQDSTAG